MITEPSWLSVDPQITRIVRRAIHAGSRTSSLALRIRAAANCVVHEAGSDVAPDVVISRVSRHLASSVSSQRRERMTRGQELRDTVLATA